MGAEVDLFYRRELPLRYVVSWELLLLLIPHCLAWLLVLSNTFNTAVLAFVFYHVQLLLHLGN
jgi:hypothetical protein